MCVCTCVRVACCDCDCKCLSLSLAQLTSSPVPRTKTARCNPSQSNSTIPKKDADQTYLCPLYNITSGRRTNTTAQSKDRSTISLLTRIANAICSSGLVISSLAGGNSLSLCSFSPTFDFVSVDVRYQRAKNSKVKVLLQK